MRLSDEGSDAQFGAFIQKSFGERVALGAEVFVTAPLDGALARTQLDFALILDPSQTHHLLFSGGPSFGAVGGYQAYAAWLVTL